jgi:ubiquinone/menaquinone biosynthesis C-methylase UbiE
MSQSTIDNTSQFRHAMLADYNADEFARQEFVKSFKLHLASTISPGNKAVYETRVVPDIKKETGKKPKDRFQIKKKMEQQQPYQFWSSLQRSSQEMMWKSVQLPVERQWKKLLDTSKKASSKYSTLELDPDLKIPKYHRVVDIHCMPGAYHTEQAKDDVAAGAIYDRAVYIYAMGRMGPYNDDIGASTVAWLKANNPDFKPKRILDMGCSVGHSTVPYVEAYPDAEVYGIDVGAPILRYAHARAESMKKKIHFSQQNAEKTNFPDGHFDLIVSNIMVHETSNKAWKNIAKECHRLLKKGGIMAHTETPPYKDMPLFDEFMMDWDTYYNNEPFWGSSHLIDPKQVAEEFGFDVDSVFEVMAPSAFEAGEKDQTKLLQCGDFGGAGVWYVFGMRK